MAVLIFGIGGQDGQYLARHLEELGVPWIGAGRASAKARGSVADRAFVEDLVSRANPTHIFHLAANSVTRHDALFDNHDAITTGSLNILEAVRVHSPQTRVFLSGSALQFVNDGQPIDEQTPPHIGTAYALSRAHSLLSARYYRETFGLRVYFGYFFNHDSELRSARHINMAIAQAALRIAGGSQETLAVGDPSVRKEFNFAGDIVRAVWLLANQDAVFEAVIGSGCAHSIHDWASLCFSRVGLKASDHIVTSDDFVPEYRQLVSNPRLIRSLGWEPQVSIDGLVDIMMGRQ